MEPSNESLQRTRAWARAAELNRSADRRDDAAMARVKSPVIGYFAYVPPMDAICTDVDACVIAGSRQAMEQYLSEAHASRASEATVRKTTFKEILRGMKLGAAYAFDADSYRAFYPLARNAGLPVEHADFEEGREHGGRFFTVRIVVR
jgi:hypothetical protein